MGEIGRRIPRKSSNNYIELMEGNETTRILTQTKGKAELREGKKQGGEEKGGGSGA